MAKARIISRTITGARIKVLLINAETKEVAEDVAFLPGGMRKTLEKTQVAIQALYEGTGYTVVLERLLDENASVRYAMKENDFMRYAEPILSNNNEEGSNE